MKMEGHLDDGDIVYSYRENNESHCSREKQRGIPASQARPVRTLCKQHLIESFAQLCAC